jgi:proline iminopeptidase
MLIFGSLKSEPMKKIILLTSTVCALLISCQQPQGPSLASYHNLEESGVKTGGVRMIRVNTPSGDFNVWTRRVGNNPGIKVLLLHGGPGMTHELYECFDSFFPQEGIEYYYYDQLGSYYSDQPTDTSLWDLPRFVEEVEQVRKGLGLDKSNFFLLGQSWGGLLAMEYALKYQDNLKGLIISNMMSSIADYMKYSDEVLGPQLPPDVYTEIMDMENNEAYDNPRYLELVIEYYYTEHVLRMPIDEWPDAINRTFKHMNPEVYVLMQGPSEFGVKGNAKLKNWEFKHHLPQIRVPTLTIGGAHDTMDPGHMKWMASEVQQGRYLHCPNGSHLSQFDDQDTYMKGVVRFIRDVDSGTFRGE